MKRKWTDQQLIEAVKESSSYSEVTRRLGISNGSGGAIANVKNGIARLNLDITHWQEKRQQTGIETGKIIYRTETSKRCSICKELKPYEDFFKARKEKDGHTNLCKPCKRDKQRAWQWSQTHGMTQDQYDEMVKNQGGRCAICNRTPEHNRWKKLYVDHRHEDNAPRGLLCSSCNQAIGLFQDNPSLLEEAAAYLRRW